MPRVARAFIWAVLAALVVLVAAQLLFGLLRHWQLLDRWAEAVAPWARTVDALSGWWLYPWLAGGVVGAFLALLADWALRRGEDTDSPIMLGWELRDLVRKIERFVRDVNTGVAKRVPPELDSEVHSAMARLGRLGIVDPRSRDVDAVTRLDMAAHFFSRIIPYLHNEQLKEAGSLAKEAARKREYEGVPEDDLPDAPVSQRPVDHTPDPHNPAPDAPQPPKPRRRILLRKKAATRADARQGPDEVIGP